ncbi:TRAP transporter permease [Pseudomonas aeruginosa]|uniref:TRAP transporter permease n=1 Tax=Pseudomonas aeruginosa TaxID=287 RepID=UPI0004D67476|nr:TRAP transporter permease [Pseudomonas aeruginosa]KEF90977.1 C4-dicarboxylate ABC transporter [Pseudomonas aeruginosa]MBV5822776.1 TRAP transporter permease [Pseudomonas aeruginosa]MDG3888445.1 TRAP transporter permease [Pseudomonas aeruginosa]
MSDHQNGLHLEAENWPRALFAVALAFSVFQVVTAAFPLISTQVLRAMHVGLLLLVVYISYPAFGIGRPWQPLAWLLGMAGLGTAVYQWVFEGDLIQRSGELTQADMLIVLVFEAARRVMGIALPIICALFLAYGLFGEHLPGDLAHRGYGFDQIVNQLSFGTEGLYGTPTYVSATYIYLFILFGAFLEQAGMIRLFTDFAMGLFGHRVGGPAKVSVFSSALIPALLYFGSVYWMVHLEARRADLKGLPREQCPSAWGAVRERWFLLIPLLVLIALLFSGRTPLFSGTIGLALTAIVILGSAIILRVSSLGLRIAFWVALGLLCAGFFRLGIGVIFVVIAALALACWFVRGGRETLRICVRALAEGARHAIPVGIACTLVGVIIGVISLTGIATTFASYVLDLGRENLLLSLVLTMITCLVLGMGIPTIPNYIITSSIAAPALLELGVPLIVSHMFVFYFGILADLTPPVALACFAAAPIAKERGLKISFWAVRIALAGFVVPFMAVYSPALMLQEGGWGATLYVTCKAVLAIGLWGMASIGYLQGPLAWWERLVAFAAGASLVLALPISDELGFVLGALVIGWHLWRQRAREAVA